MPQQQIGQSQQPLNQVEPKPTQINNLQEAGSQEQMISNTQSQQNQISQPTPTQLAQDLKQPVLPQQPMMSEMNLPPQVNATDDWKSQPFRQNMVARMYSGLFFFLISPIN